jgi:hypothetical protein
VPAEVEYDEVIRMARESGARYFVVDSMLYSMRPKLGTEIFVPFMDNLRPEGLFFYEKPSPLVKGIRPYLIYNKLDSVSMIVYDIQPEKS